MNEYNFNVKFEKGRISTNLKRLVQNDYNSTKINFTFDKEGRKVFKMLLPDGTPYVTDIENDELIFGKGVLSQDGTYEVEIALYTEDGRLTDYATIKFEVRDELINIDEVVQLDNRLPILDTLIQEVTQIKTDAENGAFDGEDGITPTIGENGNWFIGEIDTGLPSRGEKGEKGEAGGVSIEEVKAITGELEDLSTEDKSNLVNAINEVASNSGGESQFIELNLVLESSTTSSNPVTIDSTKNASQLEVLGKAINEYVTNPRPFLLNIKDDNGNVYRSHYNVVVNNFGREPKLTQNYPLFNYSLINGYELTSWNLSIDGNWTNNVFTCTSASIRYNDTRNLMGTNDYSTISGQKVFNTIPKCSVTPTSNEHFTNKKYVDEAITSAIGTALEGSY